MQTYVAQLLEDFRYRTENPATPPDFRALNPNHPAWDYDLPHIVAMETAGYTSMYDLLQMPKEALPPVSELDESQMRAIVEALYTCLAAHQIIMDLPTPLPPAKQVYQYFHQRWANAEVKHLPPGSGHFRYEYCSYDPDECSWGTYCSCKTQE